MVVFLEFTKKKPHYVFAGLSSRASEKEAKYQPRSDFSSVSSTRNPFFTKKIKIYTNIEGFDNRDEHRDKKEAERIHTNNTSIMIGKALHIALRSLFCPLWK